MIYFTSDLHFMHNRGFIYEPRGFKSIEEHNQAIIDNWNAIVQDEDIVYVLGDLMLNDNEEGRKCFEQLKGSKYIVLGNHDTEVRAEMYFDMEGVIEVNEVVRSFKYNGYHFYLSHFPTYTSNLEKEDIKHCLINLHGHTHSKHKFYNDIPFMYNVALDAHNNTPVSIEQIIEDINNKVKECKEML